MRTQDMMSPAKRPVYRLSLLLMFALLSSCAFAPWEASKRTQDSPEKRVADAEKNFREDQEATKLRKELYVNKASAEAELMAQAEQAKRNGDTQQATLHYDRVLNIAPDNQAAQLGKANIERDARLTKKLAQAADLMAANQFDQAKVLVREVLLENPQQAQALAIQQQLNDKMGKASTQTPQLKSSSDKPISLELRDVSIKVVFDALAKATGINFILDKDIRPETKATIFVKKLSVEDAIDLVVSSNGLQKKVLSENTALIYPSTPQKMNTYQDLVIRSFYLNNTSAKQVAALLKSMLKTKDIFIDERLNMVVLRDTPQAIHIAEKLIAANDLADPEVMLDIEVLEVSRNRLQELGIVYPNQLAVLGGDTGLTLEALKNLNSGGIGVTPNPALNFRKTTGDVNLLSNPRIRVKNNEKAKILVGDKVPIITTTSTANVGVSENVTYIDVGLKLDVEPRVTLDDFVNIKVGLEVSSLGAITQTRNGATVYTIGTRNANTVLRLKDGETQILAGLILDDERKNASKLPGLGDIPFLGRLFSNQEDTKNKTEIVLAITPRILGNIRLPNAEVSEYWSGTEGRIADKPQMSFPNGGSSAVVPSSAVERLQEQRRMRQLDVSPSQAPAAESQNDVAPDDSAQDDSGSEDSSQDGSAQVAPPPVDAGEQAISGETITPASPPQNSQPATGLGSSTEATPAPKPIIDMTNPPTRF